jgi:hypothetical protein
MNSIIVVLLILLVFGFLSPISENFECKRSERRWDFTKIPSEVVCCNPNNYYKEPPVTISGTIFDNRYRPKDRTLHLPQPSYLPTRRYRDYIQRLDLPYERGSFKYIPKPIVSLSENPYLYSAYGHMMTEKNYP